MIDELLHESNWVEAKDRKYIPSIINKEYDLLQQRIRDQYLFGAMFVLRDFYEIAMKVPAIMGLIIASTNYERVNSFRNKSEEELEEICKSRNENTGASRRKSKEDKTSGR